MNIRTPTPHCWYRARSCFTSLPVRSISSDVRNWWSWRPGADWRHPEGPGSDLDGRQRHPVTHVAYPDAVAYANWAGKSLPTEAEWEYAARGGLDGATYCWGDEFAPKGRMMANTWQGEFPWQNLLLDRYERTSPVGAFPPNGYGLHDMAGNVWEWTADRYTSNHDAEPPRACCAPHRPKFGRAGRGRRQRGPCHQGGLPPVRAQLLPAVPAGGPAARDGRHLHLPPRVPLRRSCHRAGLTDDAYWRPSGVGGGHLALCVGECAGAVPSGGVPRPHRWRC